MTDFEFEIRFGTGMGWDSEQQWDAIIVAIAAAATGPSCLL